MQDTSIYDLWFHRSNYRGMILRESERVWSEDEDVMMDQSLEVPIR